MGGTIKDDMIDLHMHTTASDGQYSPAALLKMCEEAGLSLIAVTDHSTMKGYEELLKPEVRRLFSGPILPACEFSAHFKGQKIEILGYGIMPEDDDGFLRRHHLTAAEIADLKMETLLRQYRERDFPFDEAEVRKQEIGWIGFSEPIWREVSRYKENRARMRNPRSKDSQPIFFREEMGDRKSPFFFDVSALVPDAKEVCDFIRSVGGKAFIAHPHSYSASVLEELEELIETVRPDGLEVWYAAYDEAKRRRLTALCQKYELLFSGGSDFHNDMRLERGNVLGVPQFAGLFPEEEMRKWIEPLRKL